MENSKNSPGKARFIPRADVLLLPYQARWVTDTSPLKIAEKARQIGWSWATAYALVARKSLTTARLDAWISSRDELQARLFLEDCKHFASLLHRTTRDLGQVLIDHHGHSAFVLQLANGLRLHSMSSHPDAQAGKRGDRVLDEFALHPDPRQLYAIAFPGTTWGGSLEIFSTHRGAASYFQELIDEIKFKGNPKNFSLHSVSLQQALEQGFLHKLQSRLPPDDPRQDMDEAAYFDFVRRGCPDHETFLQEYCCVPADESAAFITYDMITAAEYPADEPWQLDPPHLPTHNSEPGTRNSELFAGVDVGRDHDLTVIWVCERVADTFFTRAVDCLQDQTFEAQEAALYAWLECPSSGAAASTPRASAGSFANAPNAPSAPVASSACISPARSRRSWPTPCAPPSSAGPCASPVIRPSAPTSAPSARKPPPPAISALPPTAGKTAMPTASGRWPWRSRPAAAPARPARSSCSRAAPSVAPSRTETTPASAAVRDSGTIVPSLISSSRKWTPRKTLSRQIVDNAFCF